jgi:hypothetical protein
MGYRVVFVMRKNGSTTFTHHSPSVHDHPLVMTRDEWNEFKASVDRGFDEYESASSEDGHEVAP